MTTAILACVHANLSALEAVLADAKRQGVDRIVNLGDVVGYGPSPRECLKRAMGWGVNLLGNHEEALLYYGEDFSPKAKARLEWTRERLRSDEFDRAENVALWDFLGSMRTVVEEGNVMYAHGSPRVPTREYVTPADAKNHEKMQSIFDLVKRVCFVGHSHIPHLYTSDMSHQAPDWIGGAFDLGSLGTRKALVNVGSVGQPRDGDSRACYATFDGRVVRFHRLPYDGMETAVAMTLQG